MPNDPPDVLPASTFSKAAAEPPDTLPAETFAAPTSSTAQSKPTANASEPPDVLPPGAFNSRPTNQTSPSPPGQNAALSVGASAGNQPPAPSQPSSNLETGLQGAFDSASKGTIAGTIKTFQGAEGLVRMATGLPDGTPRILPPERANAFIQDMNKRIPTASTTANKVAGVVGGALPALAIGAVAGPEAIPVAFAAHGAVTGMASSEDALAAAQKNGQQISPTQQTLVKLGGAAVGGAVGYGAGELSGAFGEAGEGAVSKIAGNAIIGGASNLIQNEAENRMLPGRQPGQGNVEALASGYAMGAGLAAGGEIYGAIAPKLSTQSLRDAWVYRQALGKPFEQSMADLGINVRDSEKPSLARFNQWTAHVAGGATPDQAAHAVGLTDQDMAVVSGLQSEINTARAKQAPPEPGSKPANATVTNPQNSPGANPNIVANPTDIPNFSSRTATGVMIDGKPHSVWQSPDGRTFYLPDGATAGTPQNNNGKPPPKGPPPQEAQAAGKSEPPDVLPPETFNKAQPAPTPDRYAEAQQLLSANGKPSISLLQRKMGAKYAEAQGYVERFKAERANAAQAQGAPATGNNHPPQLPAANPPAGSTPSPAVEAPPPAPVAPAPPAQGTVPAPSASAESQKPAPPQPQTPSVPASAATPASPETSRSETSPSAPSSTTVPQPSPETKAANGETNTASPETKGPNAGLRNPPEERNVAGGANEQKPAQVVAGGVAPVVGEKGTAVGAKSGDVGGVAGGAPGASSGNAVTPAPNDGTSAPLESGQGAGRTTLPEQAPQRPAENESPAQPFIKRPSENANPRAAGVDPRLDINDEGTPTLHNENFKILRDESGVGGSTYEMTQPQLQKWLDTADKLGMGGIARSSAISHRHNVPKRNLGWFDQLTKSTPAPASSFNQSAPATPGGTAPTSPTAQAAAPSGYKLTQPEYVKMKRELSRAIKSDDPSKVVAVADAHLKRFEEAGYPDDWARWERARDDANLAKQMGWKGMHRDSPGPVINKPSTPAVESGTIQHAPNERPVPAESPSTSGNLPEAGQPQGRPLGGSGQATPSAVLPTGGAGTGESGSDAGVLRGDGGNRQGGVQQPDRQGTGPAAGTGGSSQELDHPRPAGRTQPEQSGGGGGNPAAGAVENVAPESAHVPGLGGNYIITDPSQLHAGGLKTKFRNNVAAIQTLQKILGEGRPATPAEQETLAKFVGFGAMPGAFNAYGEDAGDWTKERDIVKDLLTPEEFEAARKSTLNAHYTSGPIVQGMWQMMRRLGFNGGRFLEPSMGVGNFFGLLPEPLRGSTALTGIELDKITGNIAKLLYPKANVLVQGFQDLQTPHGFFDAVMSNFPFGDFRVHDKPYDKFRANIHDYFFLKSLDQVRPGGIVTAITSTGTMDKGDASIREAISRKADLIAAIRLPEGAFEKNAGTQVVTDLLIFKRRGTGDSPMTKGGVLEQWLKLKTVRDPDGGAPIPINEYFANHPEQVLGTVDRKSRLYGRGDAHVSRTDDFEKRWQDAIDRIPQNVFESRAHEAPKAPVMAPSTVKEGGYVKNGDKLQRRQNGALVDVEADAKQQRIISGSMNVRDALRNLINAQLQDKPAAQLDAARSRLNRVYDQFVKQNGPLNKPENRKAFAADPDSPVVLALEKYDPKTKTATKADAFSKNTVRGTKRPESANNPSEALGISLNETGKVNVDRIAELLKQTPEQVGKQLVKSGLAFQDPAAGWQSAEQYLSGNVRRKLLEAQQAAASDARYRPNVSALEKVQPKDVPYDEIDARLGVPWVGPEDIQQFGADLFESTPDHFAVRYLPTSGEWMADYSRLGTQRHASTPQDTQIYGTPRADFPNVLEAALNNKLITIRDKTSDGNSVVNMEETAAANGKVDDLQRRFRDWIWDNDDRRQRLHRAYNDTFNNIAPVRYNGAHLTFPGMTPIFEDKPLKLREHQANAVWRTIVKGTALYAHEVGTGKTITMVASAMELRRLGLARKPAIAVLKSTFPGFLKEARELYPTAKILAVEKFDPADRKRIISQIATGDYDMVLMSHEHLGMLPMKADTQASFIQRELDELTNVMLSAQEAKGAGRKGSSENRLVKKLEKAKARLEEKLQTALAGKKDDAITFEETGIDQLFVDEAHKFKSLPVYTKQDRVKGIPQGRSDRATMLAMTSQWLRELNGGRGVVFATGTPITNTMAELFTLMRYLQTQDLEDRNVMAFDAWARNFGVITSRMEYGVAGDYAPVSRFSKFVNLPELAKIAGEVIDVQRAKDMPNFQRPKRKDELKVVPMTDTQRAYLQEIKSRAVAAKKKQPGEKGDNMLSISSDARKSALDMRLVDANASADDSNKIQTLVDDVLKTWKTDPTRTQMIFSDIGVHPTAWGYSAYRDIIDRIVAGGMPRERIINFAELTDAEKRQASARLKKGDALLGIGSTDKMGTGVNAQDHLYKLHHMDVPWRPGDVEQRDGRGWRQGNQNANIAIARLTTEGSFDTFMWQAVDAKSRFIQQFIDAMSGRGNLQQRAMQDEDTEELTPAQIMAVTSGNPLLLDKINLDRDVNELEGAARRHERNDLRLRDSAVATERRIEGSRQRAVNYQADLASVEAAPDTSGDKFQMELNGKGFAKREEADAALTQELSRLPHDDKFHKIGVFRGLDVLGMRPKAGSSPIRLGKSGISAGGSVGSIEYHVRPDYLRNAATNATREMAQQQRDAAKARSEAGKPFPQGKELAEKKQQRDELIKRMQGQQNPPAAAAPTATAPQPGGENSSLSAAGKNDPYMDPHAGKPSLQNLMDNIGGIASPAPAWLARLRQAGHVAEHFDKLKATAGQAGQSFLRALDAAKGTTAAMFKDLAQPPKGDSYTLSVRRWSGADNLSALQIDRFRKKAMRAVPNKIDRGAVGVYIEAGGDKATLKDWASQIKSDPKTVKYAPIFDAAAKLNDEQKAIANAVHVRNEATLSEARDAGLLNEGVDNYLMHVWKDPKMLRRAAAESNFASLVTKPGFTKQRKIPTYFDGIKLGMEPKNLDFADLTAAHERAFRQALAARAFIRELHEGKAADGRPLVTTSPASAREITKGDAGSAYLVRPNALPPEKFADYRVVDHPALRGWKWAAKDSEGKPIFVQGDMLVHPQIHQHLKNNLTRSAIQTFEMTVGGKSFRPGAAALHVGSEFKHVILSFSGFHQATLGIHAAEHRIVPWNVPEIDISKPDQRALIDHGLMVAHYNAQELFGEGVQSGGLLSRVPVIGPIWQTYSDYLFKSYLPRVKMAMAQHALARNLRRYPNLSKAQNYSLTADEANAAFGGLNYRVLGRNKAFQDFLRMTLIAPDFLEARARFVGQAGKPYGREQLIALLLGAAALYATGALLNMFLDGKPHLDKPFALVHNGREYRLRTVQGDLFEALTNPLDFAENRLSPLAAFGLHLATRTDKFNQPSPAGEVIKNAGKGEVPIPLQSLMQGSDPAAQRAFQMMLKMVGVNSRQSMNAERLSKQLTHERMDGKTPGMQERVDARKQLIQKLRENPQDTGKLLSEAVSKGTIPPFKPGSPPPILREARNSGLANSLIHTPVDQVMQVYQDENTTQQERQEIRPILMQKITTAKIPGEKKAEMRRQLDE